MQVGLAQCVNKGMQRDYSVDKASQEFAYENRNIRITTNGDNSFLSITNEKSTVELHPSNILCVISNSFTGDLESNLQITHNIPSDIEVELKITLENQEEGYEYYDTFIINNKSKFISEYYSKDTILKVESLNDNYSVIITRFDGEELNNNAAIFISGTIIGNATIGNSLILFTKGTSDYIYKCIINEETSNYLLNVLYEGDLNFSVEHPIECITSYEDDEVQKVYWVDGINQPRYINICKEYTSSENFNFTPIVNNNIEVNIEKEYNGTGRFQSGIIQYYITGYKKFGAESNVLYASPLYYIAPSDRGGKIDEAMTCSFKITINSNNEFDYLRIYSLVRTSLNAEPLVSLVRDVESTNNISVIDTNTNNIPLSATNIMFLGGNTIVANSIAQKNNTLFLGNVEEVKTSFDIDLLKSKIQNLKEPIRKFTNKEDEEHLPESILKFKWKIIGFDNKDIAFQYSYYNQLNNNSSEIKGFKHREVYRFGLQLQTNTNEWTQTIWLDDLVCDKYPKIESDYPKLTDNISEDYYIIKPESIDNYTSYLYLPYIWFDPSEIFEDIEFKGFTNYRLVMAESSYSDRSIICQGYVNPTLYNPRLGHVNSWNIKPINEYNKHGNNVLYLDKNDGDLTIPTPKTEIDLSAYEEGRLNDTSFIEGEGSLETKWQLQDIKVTYKCLYLEGNLAEGHVFFDFRFFNGSEYKTVETTAINEDIALVNKLIIANTPYRYKTFEKTREKATYLKYTNNCYEGHYIDWEDVKDLTKNSFENIIYGKLGGKENVLTIFDKYILAGNDEFPYVEKKEARTDGADNDFEKSLTVFKRIDVDFLDTQKSLRNNHYFINANKCSLHAPNVKEIESIVNNANLKFRIVGKTDLTKNISDCILNAEDTTYLANIDKKIDQDFTGNFNNDLKTYGLQSYPLWYSYARSEEGEQKKPNSYNWVYLWTSGSLSKIDRALEGAKSTLKNKTFGNLFFGDITSYNIDDNSENKLILWESSEGIKNLQTVINSKSYINGNIYSKEVEDLIIPETDIYYYMENPPVTILNGYDYKNTIRGDYGGGEQSINFESINIKYNSTEHIVFDFNNINNRLVTLPNYFNILKDNLYNKNLYDINTKQGFPVEDTDYTNRVFQNAYPNEDNYFDTNFRERTEHSGFSGYYEYIGNLDLKNNDIVLYFYKSQEHFDPNGNPTGDFYFGSEVALPKFKVGIYKSKWSDYEPTESVRFFNPVTLTSSEINPSPGILIVDEFKNIVVPIIENNDIVFNFHYSDIVSESPTFDTHNKYQLVLKDYSISTTEEVTVAECIEYNPFNNDSLEVETNNSIWVAELYKDFNDYEPFGGTSDNAIELNTFIPISSPTKLNTSCNGLEGDTYFQRWDSLRTYPITEDDTQSIVDVVSLMIETHDNLDGRSDVTRGRTDVVNIRPNNIQDTINTVYSQSNNYITSNVLDEKFDFKHPTLYTWSLSKNALSDVDNWTKINLSSSNVLDGDKGSLNKIINWNDKLLAFQDKGISIINFNNQTTISTQEGIPVEIANSGKVTGHYYLTTTQGCKNKWSIIDSPYGLYFIDSYNKSINVFSSDGIKSLSTINLFEDWIRENEKSIIWNPNNTQGFKSFYDPIHKEVYFVNDKEALCYNELLQQFTSFYDYGNMNTLVSINGHMYGIKDIAVHKMFEGTDYCNLFGEQRDYFITYKINKDPFIDKTWTNIEYRADIFNSGTIEDKNSTRNIPLETFDTLEVWNEYQKGIMDLSKAKCKFRIWRADIPRDINEGKGLNRIRNPWIMLKLNKLGNKRMEFHDLLIKYLQ